MKLLIKFVSIAAFMGLGGFAHSAPWGDVCESSATVVTVSVSSSTATALDSSGLMGGRKLITISSATDLYCGFAASEVSTSTGKGFLVAAVTGVKELRIGSSIRLWCQHTAGGGTTKPVSLGQCR